MSLATVISKGIAVADNIFSSFQGNVTHKTWTGQDGYGSPTFTSVSRIALIEQNLSEHRLKDGVTVVTTKAKLTFLAEIPANGATGRTEPIDPKDEFILPDGMTGPIVDVQGFRNPEEGRPFLLEVWLGV